MADVAALRIPEMEEDVPYVLETIRILRRELEGRVPLIGFGGAPFTLACYMVEGKGSKDFASIKQMMYCAPEVYAALMDKITVMLIAYLKAQIAAGAQAIQVFDTWGGVPSPSDYEKYVLPYTSRLIAGLGTEVPVIHFVKGAGTMLESVRKAGGDVMGLDWHVNLGKARDQLGSGMAVQGNLDPTVLFGPKPLIEAEVKRILDENGDRPGHIFNLGHGILPTVPPENAIHMVECVHRLSHAVLIGRQSLFFTWQEIFSAELSTVHLTTPVTFPGSGGAGVACYQRGNCCHDRQDRHSSAPDGGTRFPR